ncbi:MAG: TenA family transcriptional regulator [Chitinophagales bacterium]
MTFFKTLETDLETDIQKILNHPFLERIATASLSLKQLQVFAEQYAIYCFHFPRFLAATAANIPDDTARFPIIENLWEEHGEGNIKKSHRTLYQNFAKALELNIGNLSTIKALDSTKFCVENLLKICQQTHFLESLGALGPGTEFFTSEEYQKIADGLLKYDFLNETNMLFWTVHISLDENHYSDMMNVLIPYIENLENQRLITRGAKQAVELELLFWNGLEENLNLTKK